MKDKYKFLVFDVDNTTTESCAQISNDMANTLNKLKEELVFISGTHASELKRMISSKLDRKHHILANTGTHYLLVFQNEEKEIHKKTLEKEEKEEIISALKKLQKEYNLLPITSEKDQIQDRDSQITFSILERNAPRESKASYDQDKTKREKFILFLKEILEEGKYGLTIGGTTSIDITKKDIKKGNSLEDFMRTHSLSKNDMLFFGDQLSPSGNDYSVIKTGIKCIKVENPEETLEILKTLL